MSVLIAHFQSLPPTAESALQAGCVILAVAAYLAFAILVDALLMKRSRS